MLSVGLSSVLSSVLAVNPGYCHTDPCADARGSLLGWIAQEWLFLVHGVSGMAECWRCKGVNAVRLLVGWN